MTAPKPKAQPRLPVPPAHPNTMEVTVGHEDCLLALRGWDCQVDDADDAAEAAGGPCLTVRS